MSLRGRCQRYGLAQAAATCLALACLTLSGASCSKESEKAETSTVAPLPEEEVTRGHKACEAYVARVCECATAHADMAEECAMAKARPEAFQLNLDVLASEGLSAIELQASKAAARKIAAACFEADGRLDPTKCPRPSK